MQFQKKKKSMINLLFPLRELCLVRILLFIILLELIDFFSS